MIQVKPEDNNVALLLDFLVYFNFTALELRPQTPADAPPLAEFNLLSFVE